MKKLNLMLAMMLMFTVAAWAQGGGGGAGGGSGSGGGQGGGSGSGAAASSGHGSHAGGGSSASGNSSASGSASGGTSGGGDMASSGNRTLEGCVVQQGSDYFLQRKGGKAMVRLVPQSDTDLSAHVGHTVKVHGSQQIAANDPNAPVAGKKTNITERDMASAAQGSNVPNSLTTPDQNPPAANDALAGSGALPQGSEVRGGGDFTVTRVDMVSDTCDVKTGKHHKGDNMDNNGSTNPSTPPR